MGSTNVNAKLDVHGGSQTNKGLGIIVLEGNCEQSCEHTDYNKVQSLAGLEIIGVMSLQSNDWTGGCLLSQAEMGT